MFDDLTQQEIYAALEEMRDRTDLKQTDYRVWHHGKLIPPKDVIVEAYRQKGVSKSVSDFHTNDAQTRLLQLGFPIVDTAIAESFFSEKDLVSFGQLVHRNSYDKKNPVDKNIGFFLNKVVWEKVRQWGLRVRNRGWEFAGNKVWNERDSGVGQRYKKYAWYRIYPKGRKSKLLYYTVEVSEDGTLVYKMDIQREDDFFKKNRERVTYFDTVRDSHDAGWHRIAAKNLANYDWKILVDETHSFFNKHLELYRRFEEELFGEDSPLLPSTNDRIARICWNTNSWVYPSGPKGKSSDKNSHETTHGYGHEEWLFDFNKEIDDYHYGFLEPVRKSQSSYQGKLFNVQLFTVDSESGQKFLVGEIANLEVLTSELSDTALQVYKTKGWYEEMLDQLDEEVPTGHGFSNNKGVEIFNVRFKVADCIIYPELVNLADTDLEIKSHRYSFLMDNRSKSQRKATLNKPFEFNASKKSNDTKLGKKKYKREAKQVELEHKHKDISVELRKYLVGLFGEDCVESEHPTGKGTSIDMVTKVEDETTFYEIKTYGSLRTCLRVAIGQLIEYSLWPNEDNADKLVIVSHLKPDDATIKYMKHLRESLSFPIYYQQFDLSRNVLEKLV